ncbi:MAG TPA: FAD:protein FMN transferase [Actinomycetota bacterium]
MLDRHAFRAMGTDVRVIAPAGHPRSGEATVAVHRIFEREDRRFSRFRPDSELSGVNRSAGGWTPVSDGFARLVAFALRAAADTDGRFDPSVLPAVVAAGYDRDFDEVLAGARDALRPAEPCGRWREIELEGRRLRMPAGVGLDLGGVAKGWTVDLAARAAVERGVPWVVVNAGGDLRIDGRCPGIEIAVDDPERPGSEAGRLRLSTGAIATSSVTQRAWGPGLHHLIDPASGRPADGPVLQASAWAPTCAEAEVASKAALLEGEPYLERAAALLILRDGRIVTNFASGEAAAA